VLTDTQLSEPCQDCGALRERRELPWIGGTKEVWVYPCSCIDAREAKDKELERKSYAERQDRAKAAAQQARYRDAGILRGLMGCTIEAWDFRPELAEAFETVKQYADALAFNVNQGCGLILSGDPGTGKTHLATGIIHRAIEQGIKAQIVNSTELLRSLRPGAPTPEQTEERYRTIDLLAIDDLGKEKFSEWVEEVIYHVLNFRLNDQRATIITTNFSQLELEKRIGQATVDRILQMCRPVKFDAKSLRMAKARHVTANDNRATGRG
jgi:DNA replication protein DnaC